MEHSCQLGAAGPKRWTLRRKVNREEYVLVRAEFRKWLWAGGRKLKGLVRRPKEEAKLYSE
jgi:lysozyme